MKHIAPRLGPARNSQGEKAGNKKVQHFLPLPCPAGFILNQIHEGIPSSASTSSPSSGSRPFILPPPRFLYLCVPGGYTKLFPWNALNLPTTSLGTQYLVNIAPPAQKSFRCPVQKQVIYSKSMVGLLTTFVDLLHFTLGIVQNYPKQGSKTHQPRSKRKGSRIPLVLWP